MCGQNTLTRDSFSTLSSLCTHHIVTQGAARRVCMKTCSSTCHHMSERVLFPCFVFFLCLSCLYVLSHFYLFSVLNFNSMMSRTPSIKPNAQPQNEEYCPRGDIQPSHTQWRRQRRLRQWPRHERMTVAMALAEVQHHAAPRGQRPARARGEEEDEEDCAVGQTTPLSQFCRYRVPPDGLLLFLRGGRRRGHRLRAGLGARCPGAAFPRRGARARHVPRAGDHPGNS